jgi:carbon storage regulator
MSMLVLTRKQGENVVIGDNIMVGVVQVKGNKVVLSFDAPAKVRILRGELGKWHDRDAPVSSSDLAPQKDLASSNDQFVELILTGKKSPV